MANEFYYCIPKSKLKNLLKLKLLLKISALLFFVQTTQFAMAQKSWTLADCINQALQNNISIQQQSLQNKSAKADVLQSKMAALPSINAQVNNNWQTGFNINPKTNLPEENLTFQTNSFGVSASMPLFNGFQTSNTMRLKLSDYKVSHFDLESTKNTIKLNVAAAYLQVLQQSETVEAALSQVKATRAQVQRQQKMYDFGGLNKSKLMQVIAQLTSEELNLISAENNLSQSYLDLWQMIDIKPDTINKVAKLDLSSSNLQEANKSVELIYVEFEKQSPDVLAAQQRLRSADLQRYIALGGRSLRLNLNASLSSFYSSLSTQNTAYTTIENQPIGYWNNSGTPITVYSNQSYKIPSASEVISLSNQFNKNLGTTVGFTLSLPIFNSWNVNTNIQKSSIQHEISRLNDKQVKQILFKNVTQAYFNYKNAMKKLDASQNNLFANQEAYDISQKQFELGALNVGDYLLSKNNLIKAETALLQSKYELIFRNKILHFYLGKEL